MKPKVLMIVGPTAVGKTALSIALAKAFDGEIISGDSMQIYRHLDIGTAKVTKAEMAGIPHHLIDICDVTERFTVHDFKTQATEWINHLTAHHKLPIIAGGTGFYLNALRLNLNLGDQSEAKTDQTARSVWSDYYDAHGSQVAWELLQSKDPLSAEKIAPTNKRRVVRALEVIHETGQLFSDQQNDTPAFDCLIIGLNTERSRLYQRINQRVDQFVDAGLLPEAKWLYDRRESAVQASKGIGYKELFPYFDGTQPLTEALEMVKRNSRRYAKRQLTYFRNQMPTHWFDPFADPHWQDAVTALVNDWQN